MQLIRLARGIGFARIAVIEPLGSDVSLRARVDAQNHTQEARAHGCGESLPRHRQCLPDDPSMPPAQKRLKLTRSLSDEWCWNASKRLETRCCGGWIALRQELADVFREGHGLSRPDGVVHGRGSRARFARRQRIVRRGERKRTMPQRRTQWPSRRPLAVAAAGRLAEIDARTISNHACRL